MAKLKPVPSTPEVAPAPAPKSKKKLIFIVTGVIIVIAIGVGAWWFFLRSHGAEAPAAPAEKKPPVFQTLDPFTVNLQPENGDHYLQVGVVYQVDDSKVVEDLKTYMPILRSRILLVLSAKRPSELATTDGKQKLVAELISVARETLPNGKTPERGIESAFLSAFVIQ